MSYENPEVFYSSLTGRMEAVHYYTTNQEGQTVAVFYGGHRELFGGSQHETRRLNELLRFRRSWS